MRLFVSVLPGQTRGGCLDVLVRGGWVVECAGLRMRRVDSFVVFRDTRVGVAPYIGLNAKNRGCACNPPEPVR